MSDNQKLSPGRSLTAGNEYKVILLYVLPIFMGNIFQQLYNVVDSIVVGRILGAKALAAVGTSFGINSIILAVAMGMTLGYSILISKLYGAGEYDKIQDVIDTGMIVSVVAAAVIMIVCLIWCEELIGLFHVPDDIRKDVIIYFKIILAGTIPLFGYNSIANFLRGTGDSRTPLYFLIVSSVINLILDLLFVGTFSMGVAGAAAATIIAQYLSFVTIIIYVNQRHASYRIKYIKLYFNKRVFWEGMKIGVPAMLQQLFIGLGSSVIQILINDFGTIPISAYTAASKIDGFAVMPAVNIGKAMSNYVAQNIGAGQMKRVQNGIKAGFVIIAGISLILSAVVFAAPQALIKLFCKSAKVCEAGTAYLKIISPFYIVFGVMQILNGILLGKGKAFISMFATIGSFCLLQVPAAIVLSKFFGINGIWIAAPIGWLGGTLIRYLYHKRLEKNENIL